MVYWSFSPQLLRAVLLSYDPSILAFVIHLNSAMVLSVFQIDVNGALVVKFTMRENLTMFVLLLF